MPGLPLEITRLLQRQAQVVSRRQTLDAGLADHDIRRLVRRREWAGAGIPGAYVGHTGPLTELQRAWAAVLAAWPAALYGEWALRCLEEPGRNSPATDRPVHVAVDRDRALRAPIGVRLHRIADFDAKVQLNTSPPRQRIEEAALDVAAAARDDLDAVGVLAGIVGARRTTARRLSTALAGRSRLPRRAFLASVIADLAGGTCSTLEHGFLVRVERAHGLPTPQRQVHESRHGSLYRDVEYAAYGLLVELDGLTHHTSLTDRDHDLDRDLDAVVDTDRLTVRLGRGQVFRTPCRTADRLARLLVHRGWTGSVRACPTCDSGGSSSAGDQDPPLSGVARPQISARTTATTKNSSAAPNAASSGTARWRTTSSASASACSE